MENLLQVFDHPEWGKLHTILIDGVPYFKGKDVAEILGYENASKAVRDHVDPRDKKLVDLNSIPNQTPITDAVSGGWIKNEVMFINESGLYRLIFSSKLPKARDFTHWVTSEVLPAIRETGSYSLPNAQAAVAVQNPPVVFNLPVASALKDIEISAEIAMRLYGAKRGIALAASKNAAETNHKVDLSAYDNLLPAATHEIGRFTPTKLGKLIAKEKNLEKFSAQKVNEILTKEGLQIPDGEGGYTLTDAGKKYGEAMPFNNNGHSGYQIKWSAEVMKFFK